MSTEPLSPVQVEAKLRQALNDLTRAQFELQRARDDETDAEIAYKRAFYKATLSPQAPTVERGGATVAERDAWVARQCFDEWQEFRVATAVRESAQDHLRTVRDVTEVLRSLGASVRTAYENAGRADR